MVNNNLIKVLSVLSRREMTRFRDYVHSPYFNKHRDVINLADYLSDIYPDFSEKKCDRSTIFRHLYPTRSHDQQKLAVIFTYTLRLLEQFIATEFSKDKDPAIELMRFYRSRGMFELLEKKWKENFKGVKIKNGNKLTLTDTDSSRLLQQISRTTELDLTALSLAKHDQHFLEDKQTLLDGWFITEKLKDACELIQRSRFRKMTFTPSPLLDAISGLFEENNVMAMQFPPAVIYYSIYQLLRQNDPARYRPTLRHIQELEAHLPASELQNSYNYLQNFCIAQINRGNNDFLRAIFDLYQLQLKKQLLLVNNQFPEWHYKNIVTTGLRLGETNWVLKFINQYRPLLNPNVAENAYSYNLAAYHYHRREFDRVLELLLHVEYTDLRYNLDAKSLLLRTYYDLEAEDAVFALTDAFRQFLKRNRSLTEFQKKGYYNLLKFTRRTFRLKISKGFRNQTKWEKDLEKLRADVSAAQTVFNQGWLMGKINAICQISKI